MIICHMKDCVNNVQDGMYTYCNLTTTKIDQKGICFDKVLKREKEKNEVLEEIHNDIENWHIEDRIKNQNENYTELLTYRENDIDKIIYACKEADCGMNCKLYINIDSDHQHIFKKDLLENDNHYPYVCPFKIVTPIWKYEGINLVKRKVDEVVIHG